MEPPRFRPPMLAASDGHFGELPEDGMQKPAEPDAFTLALLPDMVHSVIPVAGSHQGKAVTSHGETAVQCARTMFKESGSRVGHTRLEIRFMLSFGQHRTIQKG